MAGCCFHILFAFFVCFSIFGVEGKTHVKGLLCQDPDTRKLYPINSTWPSESFCGNYTCKLRQKNLTQTEYAPASKINIMTLEKGKPLSNDMDTSPSEQAFVVIKKVHPTQQPVFHKEIIKKINAKTDEYKFGGTDNDRYLTESEIKSITEILHTIKKSDLDAIVEIYNIAQDIYKEIDNNGEKQDNNGTDLNTVNTKDKYPNKKLSNKAKDSVSYWYEPLHQGVTKAKVTDSKVEGTNVVNTNIGTKIYSHPTTYFNGPLTDRDFRKLPYYYPLSNFQRTSSYVHNKAPQNNAPHHAKPCSKKFNNIAPTWVNTHTNNVKPKPGNNQMMQPVLLPYPFSYVHQYNFSAYPASFYYSHYPWSQDRSRNYPQHNFGAYVAQVPQTVVVANVEEINQKSDASHFNSGENAEITNKAEQVKLPEWQTKELSAKILEEVKANILEDSILKPLNKVKNIKLEKVGKVIKLDELTRTKRDINNIDTRDTEMEIIQYEPYIEKTTCESSNELGYFRLGNQNEPYPACCPQKIVSS